MRSCELLGWKILLDLRIQFFVTGGVLAVKMQKDVRSAPDWQALFIHDNPQTPKTQASSLYKRAIVDCLDATSHLLLKFMYVTLRTQTFTVYKNAIVNGELSVCIHKESRRTSRQHEGLHSRQSAIA